MERLSSAWLDRIRAMSVGERLADTLALTDLAIEMGRSQVREHYPNADDREVRLRNAARHLSRDLMIRAYGWDPDAHKDDGPALGTIDCEFAVETMILSKLRWYRAGGETSERQWNDLRGVIQVSGPKLDVGYLCEWAPRLNVADLLERLLAE